jgi:hypothetical protein
MKKYQSHKIVEAAPIYGTDPSTSTVVISEAGHPRWEVEVPKDFFARGVPGIGDYLVRYQPDGYLSWSPKAVFEAGYSAIDGTALAPAALAAINGPTPAAVEVTVTAPAGKRAEVCHGAGETQSMFTVAGGQSQTWSVIADEALVVCEGKPHETVAHKRDAS